MNCLSQDSLSITYASNISHLHRMDHGRVKFQRQGENEAKPKGEAE